jgi:hypothetical protein
MIDIARAMVAEGSAGDYGIGRERTLSAAVLGMFGVSAAQFVEVVRAARTDDDIADRLWSGATMPPEALSARLRRVTVADVPAELRPEFERLYGAEHPGDRRPPDDHRDNLFTIRNFTRRLPQRLSQHLTQAF